MPCVHLNPDGDCAIHAIEMPTKEDCASCMKYSGIGRGAGDIVAKIANVTKISVIAKTFGCGGCGKRRALLNTVFPSKQEDGLQ